jgi:hypothetical protein
MMKKYLIFPEDLPPLLQNQYDQSNLNECLKGIMLESNGCNSDLKTLNVCHSCQKSLLSNELPKNSISNGFYYGHAPECLRNLNRTECAMLNWSIPCVYLTSIAGGTNMCLRSHSYQLVNSHGPVAVHLPNNVLEQGLISVSIVGQMSLSQRTCLQRKHQVSCESLCNCSNWLKNSGNIYYENLD